MLYDRIIGRDDNGQPVADRIAPELLAAVISEYVRGIRSEQESLDILAALGASLDASEADEAGALLATITGVATAKLARYLEIRDVLFLARLQAIGYSRPYEVKARLGV